MSTLIVPLILAGGGLSAASAIQQGRAAKAQGSFDKKMALRGQESFLRQGRAEQAASALEERRIAKKQKIHEARNLAIMGASGSGVMGATLAALVSVATAYSEERNLALRRGVFRAGALRERGEIMAAQGRWSKTLGNQANRLGYVKAGASLLMAAGTASYYGGSGSGTSPWTPTTNISAQNTSNATILRY